MVIAKTGQGGTRYLSLCALMAGLAWPLAAGWSEEDLAGMAQQVIDIEADQLEHDRQAKTITAVGGVHLERAGELKLDANQAVYHTDSRRLEASEQVDLHYPLRGLRLRTDKLSFDTVAYALEIPDKVEVISHGDRIRGQAMILYPRENRGSLDKLVLDMHGDGGHATAEHAEMLDANTMTLDSATFTNCNCEDPPWQLEADSLFLDKEHNQLVARNAALYLKGIPIAYTPWWQQTLFKQRQTGFLIPTVGNSGARGLELDIPYYFNIAPDLDATVTLHPTVKRGLLGKGQFRYLGEGFRGVMEGHGIYDTETEHYRGLMLLDHKQNVEGWHLEGLFQRVYSRNYLQDFPQEVVDEKSRNLESDLLANRVWSRKGGLSEVRLGANWFQNLEAPSDQFTLQRTPYARLEDIRPLGSGWYLENHAGLDNFYRVAGDTIQRLDLAPTLGFRQPLYIGGLAASLGVRETGYWFQGMETGLAGEEENFRSRESSHLLLRLDGNLSRVYPAGEGKGFYRHTIEPAVQYVMNASSRQELLPRLDTELRDMTVTNLFSRNLFTGPDRMANGQWIAYGVTNRLTGPRWGSDKVGEMAAFTIGQRWAPAEDREFQRDHAVSDVVNNLDLFLSDQWSLSAGSLINPYAGELDRTDTTLWFHSERGDQIGFGHYFDRDRDTEDAVLVASIKLTDSWRWIQEGDYSLARATLNNWKSGLMYEHACWSIQVLGGRNLIQDTNQHSGGWVGFLLNFKGLGGYGLHT